MTPWQGCEFVGGHGPTMRICRRPVVATVSDLRRPNDAPMEVCAHHAAMFVTKDREGGKPRYRVEKHR